MYMPQFMIYPFHLKKGIAIQVVVVAGSSRQSQRCGFAALVGAVHNDSTVSVISFDIAGTLKQKVGVALPTSAAPPPKRRFDE